MRQLRPYQAEGERAVWAGWRSGRNRVAVVMATGLGKTDVLAAVATKAAADGIPVLALAHRMSLLTQITERCRMHDPSIPIGLVGDGKFQPGFPITVAMTPTMARPERRARIAKIRPPGLVIYDEVHHAAAPSSMEILRWAGCFDRTPMLGLTATLTRSDRYGLGDVFSPDDVVFTRDIVWAVAHGYLVRPRGKVVVVEHLDLAKAKVSKGDYQDNDLGEMIEQDTDQIVSAWMEHASDRVTVAFTPTVASAHALATEFVGAGVSTEVVVGTTPERDREQMYARLAAGSTRVLVTVMVCTEGWDCPPVSCILQCRPTRLPGLYQQMVGRGLRLLDHDVYPGHPPKSDCLVLDVVGASRGQRLSTVVDLHPTAEYDTTALDERPCWECDEFPCICPDGLGEDVDEAPGGIVGPRTYEDLDLLLMSSRQRWLMTDKGVPFLAAGDRIGVLWRAPGTDLYKAGTITKNGPRLRGERLAEHPVDLDSAKLLVEAWAAQRDDPYSVRSRSRGTATLAQQAKAREWGIPHPERHTRAEVSDMIEIAMASQRLRRFNT